MANEKPQNDLEKIAASGSVGIGMIYGAGVSGLATSIYIAATGNKSAVWLFFLEAGLAFTGLAKSMRSDHQLRQNPASNDASGPSG